jgi:glutamate synthase (NADPH/NADH) small chain
VLSGGAEQPRDLPVPGRELDGVHFAMDFLALQNRRVAGDKNVRDLWATDKHVIVIGGGDTGSDCVGTSNRHGAKSVTQLELLPMPPDPESNPVWPYWPTRLRTSSSHEEGVKRDWSVATKAFVGEGGKVKGLRAVRLENMKEIPGSEFTLPADLVLLAMGFVSPVQSVLEGFGVEKSERGNAKAATEGPGCYTTSVAKVFAAGDMRRGQSLVVWAIREGRQCARAVDEFLMGSTELPR